MKSQKNLFGRFIKDIAPGTLTWIGLRPKRKHDMIPVKAANAIEGLGLEGDHRCEKTPGSARQVTIISEEYIQQIEHYTHRELISPEVLRRNLVVKGLNLTAIRHQTFQIGEAMFEATALCHPCSRMEQALGKGGVAAMLGHGGLCARIIKSGRFQVGDKVEVILPIEQEK